MEGEKKSQNYNKQKVDPNNKQDSTMTKSKMNRFAEATRQFCLQSTLHGLANLFQRGSTLLKIAWFILIGCLMGWFMYEGGKVIREFRDYPMMTKITAQAAKLMPEIRICPFFFIDPKKMQAHGLSSPIVNHGLEKLYRRSQEALWRSLVNEASNQMNTTSEMSSLSITQTFLADAWQLHENKSVERLSNYSQQLERELEIRWNQFLSGRKLGDGFRQLSYNFTEFIHNQWPELYNETYREVRLEQEGICYILKEKKIVRTPGDYTSKISLAVWVLKNKHYHDTNGTNAIRMLIDGDEASILNLVDGSSYQVYFTAQRRVFVQTGCVYATERERRIQSCFQRFLRRVFPGCRCFINERADLEDNNKNVTGYCSTLMTTSFIIHNPDIEKEFAECSTRQMQVPLCEKWEYSASFSPIKTADVVPASQMMLQSIEMVIQLTFVNSEAVLTITEMPSFRYDQAMSAVGGLFGLFMGGSIISVLHIPYFCITRLLTQPD